MEFRKTDKRPVRKANGKVQVPKSHIKMKNTTACLVIFFKRWAYSGYGAKKTVVIHRWPPKSVLERSGVWVFQNCR